MDNQTMSEHDKLRKIRTECKTKCRSDEAKKKVKHFADVMGNKFDENAFAEPCEKACDKATTTEGGKRRRRRRKSRSKSRKSRRKSRKTKRKRRKSRKTKKRRRRRR